MAMTAALALQGAQSVLALILAPLITGIVRKTKARFQLRRGASILQPYRDLARLLRKESVLADNASWLFDLAPTVILAFTWVAAALIPVLGTDPVLASAADLIAIVGLLASARFVLALAGLDIGTSFGGIGASREVMIASVAEPAMLMLIFALALIAGSTHLPAITAFVQSPALGLRISLGLGLIGLIMVAIAENGRIPIDNPSTHLELTMVHEAMVLEYSGRHLALIELASSLKLLLYLSLIIAVFLPWGADIHWSGWPPYAERLLVYLAKIVALAFLLGLFEVSIAKMRVFRVPQFLGAALMLTLLAVLLRLVSGSF
ncbi:MAG: NADH-quinone oxidoreductase subunit H [Alphaproteobacteria bacterium]|nr:NADH-quinone oxidoreductase subunit H [Alphaproteobacteria bacterium]MBV9692766.1 NADH-quinone oxidoreductase subunit H [Alphaproteobacteria bacterium]